MGERTLVLLKPDAIQRRIAGRVLARLEGTGLKIIGMKMIQLDDEILNEHYAHLTDKPFFAGIRDFMKSAPVIAIVLEGDGAVEITRKVVGATKPWEADAGTIRGDMATGLPANLIHASDSPENAEIEIKRFFNENEIHPWNGVLDYLFERR